MFTWGSCLCWNSIIQNSRLLPKLELEQTAKNKIPWFEHFQVLTCWILQYSNKPEKTPNWFQKTCDQTFGPPKKSNIHNTLLSTMSAPNLHHTWKSGIRIVIVHYHRRTGRESGLPKLTLPNLLISINKTTSSYQARLFLSVLEMFRGTGNTPLLLAGIPLPSAIIGHRS